MPQDLNLETGPYPLTSTIQNYAWGTRDKDALIPKILGIQPQPGVPYAELWLGAHPKAPSTVRLCGQDHTLDQLPAAVQARLFSADVMTRFSGLPFLFKVLSINQALSIQAHPNKLQAKVLHARAPGHYADSRHKPEVAIALDDFSALVGFRAYEEILDQFTRFKALREFPDPEVLAQFRAGVDASEPTRKQNLKSLYGDMMRRAAKQPRALIGAIQALAEDLASGPDRPKERRVFDTCYQQYGPDEGLFSIFLLNLGQLKAGQGIFLPAGTPHAYLYGNIVECMANSDNVVRAGLTPKHKDLDTLMEILTYQMGQVVILGGEGNSAYTAYPIPTEEFEISRYLMKPGESVTLNPGGRVALAFVAEGCLTDDQGAHCSGSSWLLPAGLKHYSWTASTATVLFAVRVPPQLQAGETGSRLD